MTTGGSGMELKTEILIIGAGLLHGFGPLPLDGIHALDQFFLQHQIL